MASSTSHALDAIDLIGPHLDGCGKYSFAVTVGDCVYAVPCHAKQVMRVNCKTGDVQHIGPIIDGDGKYVSAVAVGDCVYALPCNAKQVLRISCETGEVQPIGPTLDGDFKYRSAVAVGDCVYGVPDNAMQVLRINCKTGEVKHIGPHLDGGGKYWSAVAVGDCVYALPWCSKQVMRISCKTGDVQHMGPKLHGACKYHAAVAVGDCVYAAPYHAKQVLRINCKTGDVQHIGPHLDGDAQYSSAVAVNDCVYALPSNAKQVLRINCNTGEMQHMGPHLNGDFKYSKTSVAVNDCVYALPCNAKQVLRINCNTGEVQHIGPHLDGDFKYHSAVAVNDCVYAVPCHAKQVLRINCKTSPSVKHAIAAADEPLVTSLVSSLRHLRWADGVEAPAAGMRQFYPSGFKLTLDVPSSIAQFGHTSSQIRVIMAAGDTKASTSPAPISKEHAAALFAYTEESPLYRALNYAMRTPSTPSNPTDNQLQRFRDYIMHAERALSCMPTHVSEMVGPIYRGMNTLLNPTVYAPAKYITWQSFTSCTKNLHTMLNFLDKLPGRKLQGSVFVIHSITGKDISHMSEYAHEEEVLLPPNAQFQVEKVVTEQGEKLSVLLDYAAYDLSELDVYQLQQLA